MFFVATISATAIQWITSWCNSMVDTTKAFIMPLAGLLQEFFWWMAAQVMNICASGINEIGDKWPPLSFHINDVLTWWNYGNHWLPLNEGLLFFSAWLQVVLVYFLIKVILYLF